MRSAFALRIFSGKIIFNRAMPERLRTLRHCIFTGGVVKENGICSAAFCESAALRLASSPSQALTRQIPPFVTCGDIFPRSGGSLSSKGEPLAKPYTSQFNRQLCRHAKASPFGRGGCERSEQTERARMLTLCGGIFHSSSSGIFSASSRYSVSVCCSICCTVQSSCTAPLRSSE